MEVLNLKYIYEVVNWPLVKLKKKKHEFIHKNTSNLKCSFHTIENKWILKENIKQIKYKQMNLQRKKNRNMFF